MAAQSPTLLGKPLLARLLLLAILITSVTLLLSLVDQQQVRLPTNDFTMYWSSAKLLLSGANPYDPAGLANFQNQETSQDTGVVLMYYPPWSMLWIAPFGLLKHDISQVVWLLIHTAVFFYCTHQLWLHIGGQTRYRWAAWLVAFTFGPTFAALGYTGQITPLMLLGFSLFEWNINRPEKDWLGGIFILLVGIKPQVFHLFIVLFLIWVLQQRRWILLISATITMAVATLLSMLFDHQIISHFMQNLNINTPTAWSTPTLGTYLRYYLGIERFEVQYIPAFLSSILAIFYWWRKRESWDWQTSLPWILFVSIITAPYTWSYDFTPLIIPLLMGFSWILPRISYPVEIILAGIYGLINSVYWWMHLKYSDFYFIWYAPVLFIWFIMAWRISLRKIINRDSASPRIL